MTFDPEAANAESSGLRCESCDYDLRGISAAVCPECGADIHPGRSRQLELVEQETLRNEIRKPVIIGCISLALWLGLFAFRFGLGPAAIQLALFPAFVIATSIVYMICASLSGGIDPPLWLIALRMAAIVPAVKLVETIFKSSKLSGSSSAGLVLGGLLFTFLIVDLFDLDFEDVRVLIVLNSIAWLTIQFIVYRVI